MNYDDPQLRDILAAEYALGTLRGAARRRFERLMARDQALRALATDWELHLNTLAEAAPAIEPSPRVWQAIERRLPPRTEVRRNPLGGLLGALFGRPATPIPTMRTAGLWYCVGFWRAAGLASMAATILLAAYVALGPMPGTRPDGPSHVAVLSDPDAQPVLLANFEASTGQLTVRPVELPGAEPDHSLELWLLPPGEAAPRSLGLLAGDRLTLNLNREQAALLARGGLAVSLEPAGGSPTGLPTGPVLYVGRVLPTS